MECVVMNILEILYPDADFPDLCKSILDSVILDVGYFNVPENIELCAEFMVKKLLQFHHTRKDSKTVLRVLHMYECVFKIPRSIELQKDYIIETMYSLDFVNSPQDLYDGEHWVIFFCATFCGKLDIVKFLVKYGLICEEKRFMEMKTSILHLARFIKWSGSRLFPGEDNYPSWMNGAADEVPMLLERGKLGNNQRGFARIYILIRIVKSIILRWEGDLEVATFNDIIRALELYYSAVNEPFVTQDEIKDFLKLFFAKEENFECVAETIVDCYRGMIHAGSTQVYEPRSLKQQSRCAVRKQLSRRAVSLPYLVHKQNVPPVVKELLLGAPEFSS